MPAAHITSVQNSLVKQVRQAARSGQLVDGRWAVAEGWHLLQEAAQSGVKIGHVLVTPDQAALARQWVDDSQLVMVSTPVLAAASATESAPGVITLVELPARSLADCLGLRGLHLALDGVQDPGNVGTILRSAEAFGAASVILLDKTARPSNGKVLRAAAGSLFRLAWCTATRQDLLAAGVPLWATVPAAGGGLPLDAVPLDDMPQGTVIVIGSEGQGVSRDLLSSAQRLTVPTVGVESLNAAVTAAVVLYEAQRRRR